jgi:type II secretory pathway component GspD/PulD (secretin)
MQTGRDKMKACRTTKFWGVATATVLAATLVQAQQDKVEDQDLLNLLDKVNQEAAAEKAVPPADNPEHRAAAVVEVVGDWSSEVDTVDAAIAPREKVDDLSMSSSSDYAANMSAENLISVRLNKVGLEEAITLFARLSGANIIVPELEEAAQISVNLKDVEWRPALQSILDTYDYELYQRVAGSSVYSVRRRPEGAPEPQVVETFVLKYATVPNAAELIRNLLPEDAKVSEFASRNMLVVKSTESSLGEVRGVLAAIDTVRQQVYIESKFMELSDEAQKDLGIDWSALEAYSFGTSGETSKSITQSKTDSRTSNNFYDLSGTAYEDASGYSETQRGGSALSPWTLEGITPSLQDTVSKSTSEVLTSVLSADEFRLVLSALEQNSGVNVVSNPKIIVANEEPANISIVRKEPNLVQDRQESLNDTGDNVTYSLDEERPFFEYGIKLDVTPSINTSSNITVNINPSLTRFYADKEAGDTTYPIIDEKSIKTVFNLASGQTAAIGGLTEVTESEEESKVPVLGSLPLLGRFFSWKQTVRGQDETIIFVTVGLANTQTLTEEVGMPSDSELARRQVIQDINSRKLRDQGRIYYEAGESDKLEDMLKAMRLEEQKRLEERDRVLQEAQEKEAAQISKLVAGE